MGGKTSNESKAKYNAKAYDRVNLALKKGSKERIAEAATATGQSTNGFIRSALNKAVEDAIGRPMEDSPDTEKACGPADAKEE